MLCVNSVLHFQDFDADNQGKDILEKFDCEFGGNGWKPLNFHLFFKHLKLECLPKSNFIGRPVAEKVLVVYFNIVNHF